MTHTSKVDNNLVVVVPMALLKHLLIFLLYWTPNLTKGEIDHWASHCKTMQRLEKNDFDFTPSRVFATSQHFCTQAPSKNLDLKVWAHLVNWSALVTSSNITFSIIDSFYSQLQREKSANEMIVWRHVAMIGKSTATTVTFGEKRRWVGTMLKHSVGRKAAT